MVSTEADIRHLKKAKDWRREDAAHIFGSDGSLDWFLRMHTPELVKSGALILRKGRSGNLVTRAAVASFKIDEYGRIEYKFWDKNSALDKAAKILGLYELDNKQKSDPLVDLLASLSGNVLGPAQGLPPMDEEDDPAILTVSRI